MLVVLINKIFFKIKFFFSIFFNIFYSKYILFFEQKAINKNIKSNKKIFIPFDEKVSALTYGEYLNFVFLCRYFVLNNLSIVIVFINDNYRTDFENLENTSPVQSFINDRFKLIELIVKENYTIESITWDNFKLYISDESKFILFSRLVSSRKSIYNYCFNLNVLLLKNSRKEVFNDFPLSKYNIEFNFTNKLFDKDFITIGVRYNKLWRTYSNTKMTEFNVLINTIHNFFPDTKIVILSDIEGCNFFRNNLNNTRSNIFFSDNIHRGFIGSLSLILYSKLYIQFKGGGIGMGAIYSNVPYIISSPVINEFMFKKYSIASWSTYNQYFINKKNASIEKILNKFLLKLTITSEKK